MHSCYREEKASLMTSACFTSLGDPGPARRSCWHRRSTHLQAWLFSLWRASSHLHTPQIPLHFSATWKTVALSPKLSSDVCKSRPEPVGLPQALQRSPHDSRTTSFLLQSCTVSGFPGTCLTHASFQAFKFICRALCHCCPNTAPSWWVTGPNTPFLHLGVTSCHPGFLSLSTHVYWEIHAVLFFLSFLYLFFAKHFTED